MSVISDVFVFCWGLCGHAERRLPSLSATHAGDTDAVAFDFREHGFGDRRR
jgi:hypothetical protein